MFYSMATIIITVNVINYMHTIEIKIHPDINFESTSI
jgi:hypothetical protein